jgi:hypothetical protein
MALSFVFTLQCQLLIDWNGPWQETPIFHFFLDALKSFVTLWKFIQSVTTHCEVSIFHYTPLEITTLEPLGSETWNFRPSQKTLPTGEGCIDIKWPLAANVNFPTEDANFSEY